MAAVVMNALLVAAGMSRVEEEYMEEATAIMDSIIKDNELATKLGKEELENVKKFRASNAVHGSNTGVLLEFENTNMSFSFFTHVLRSGLEVAVKTFATRGQYGGETTCQPPCCSWCCQL